MLQQILKEMYIDPDVLDALNEEQKKILFLKMRQEQVRRWKEREEKVEKEEPRKPKPRPAHSKSVSWLLGCDGDVQVFVIGEMDEFKSSKILRSGFGERNAAGLSNNSHIQEASFKSNLVSRQSSEPVRSSRENLPPKSLSGVQLNLTENSKEVRTRPPPQVSACELKLTSPVESVPETEEEDNEDDLVDDTFSLSTICYRPHLMSASVLHTLAPQETQQNSAPLSITSRLASVEAMEPQISRGKDFRVMSASKRNESGVGGESRVGRGRVAELMKTFSVSSDSTCTQPPLRSNKPAVPHKPSYLQHPPSNSFR
ncbi:SH2 domain-containing protein 4A [Bagarius yarrelli]|uniref:SH2 domain-containing protein 4A n=1 Tax=Bagarius yarrelli TaxID=175774 RepID=A0A556TX76_BAGYA|nr:SH2 domain-containing protein 4A [Bagarius yarrelli]